MSLIILSPATIAQVTGGIWVNLLRDKLSISGLSVVVDLVKEGDLVFITTPRQWGRQVPNTFSKLDAILAKRPAAIVATPEQAKHTTAPTLIVENTRLALERIALAARDASRAERVLITGTQGKTGCKLLLGELISKQTVPVYYSRSSANLDVPVLLSLGNLSDEHRICLVEAAVSDRGVGTRRSQLIRPHICVFTNANPCHLGTHGGLENVIVDKADAVSGLQANGTIIINRESFFYPQLRAAISQRRPDSRCYTYGRESRCDARLIASRFENGKWNIEADILGERYRYQLGLFHSHAPASTLGALLAVGLLGLDIDQAVHDAVQFRSSYKSTGRRFTLRHPDGDFVFYDQHYSNNEYALLSAVDDLSNTTSVGKKIAVIGGFNDHVRFAKGAYVRVARSLARSDLDAVYTFGKNIHPMRQLLNHTRLHQGHFDSTHEVADALVSILKSGDVLLLKAQGAAGFVKVSEAILKAFPIVPAAAQ
ncbi:MAG: hypothetical protein H8E66_25870 [Planctomycetes bacterium]|nr:hypothetical protein [Planctomycetota bacterium]